MLFNDIAHQFMRRSPFCFLTRATIEHALNEPFLNGLFERTASIQYTRELLFSSLVDLMGSVVLRGSRSVNAAFKDRERDAPLGVSLTSVYNKLNALEPPISSALVRESAQRLGAIVDKLGARNPPLIPGRHTKILDGNHFSATEHRLKPLRLVKDAPLPGQALALLDPELDMAVNVLPCEDGHAQERSLTEAILAVVKALDCLIADRNFCTTRLLFGIARRKASFLIRQHSNALHWKLLGQRRYLGRIETGTVFEQQMRIEDDEGRPLRIRRITIELDQPTRDNETQMNLLTNLPKALVSGQRVAELYRERWKVERLFQDVTMALRCEIDTLAYPRAAIFAFSLALTAYNVLSTIRAAVRAEHGEQAEKALSEYDLANEIGGTMKGMTIALPSSTWTIFQTCTSDEFVTFLRDCIRPVQLRWYCKHVRGPKKPLPPRRSVSASSNHVSTQRLLKQARTANTP